jgi:hypothetical protein
LKENKCQGNGYYIGEARKVFTAAGQYEWWCYTVEKQQMERGHKYL